MTAERSCLACHCRASPAACSSCSCWFALEFEDEAIVIGEFVELFEVTLDCEPRSKEGLTVRVLRSRSLAVRK